jgi:hypothetical protein
MESIQNEKKNDKGISEAKHPLDRKFSSIEEASAAKIAYIRASKPESFWGKLRKLAEK